MIGRTYLYCSSLEYFLRRFNGDVTRYFSLCEYTRGVRVAVASTILMESSSGSPSSVVVYNQTVPKEAVPAARSVPCSTHLFSVPYPCVNYTECTYKFLRPFLSLCRALCPKCDYDYFFIFERCT